MKVTAGMLEFLWIYVHNKPRTGTLSIHGDSVGDTADHESPFSRCILHGLGVLRWRAETTVGGGRRCGQAPLGGISICVPGKEFQDSFRYQGKPSEGRIPAPWFLWYHMITRTSPQEWSAAEKEPHRGFISAPSTFLSRSRWLCLLLEYWILKN